MAEAFDPYHIWLGIPPEDQPPHHYRLLAVKAFESNPDVLESAADQRMAHVRSFQTGKHAAESQKLLNELAAARLCLLSPEKRPAYDRVLKAKLAAEKPAPPAPPSPAASPTPSRWQRQGHSPLRPVPLAAQAVAPVAQPAAALGFDPLEQTPTRRPSRKRGSNTSPAHYAGIGLGLIAVVAVAWIAIGGGGSDEKPIATRNPLAQSKSADTGSSRNDESTLLRPQPVNVPPIAEDRLPIEIHRTIRSLLPTQLIQIRRTKHRSGRRNRSATWRTKWRQRPTRPPRL